MALETLSVSETVLYGFTASMAAGLATGVGALPGLLFRNLSRKVLDILLGFAAGVMLAATAFSLVVPGVEYGEKIYGTSYWAILVMAGGILFGAVFLDRCDKWIPHEHFFKGHEGPSSSLRKTWLFVLAITLHNFPEGLAVGVGFGGGTEEAVAQGTTLALGIGLQNMPEGLAVLLPLMREGYSRGRALWIAAATGLVEPIAGLLGAGLVGVFAPILPFGMAFAAGAMLFVISDEIIPETHRGGYERAATFGIVVGFVVMMAMDILLG
ncbi:MAG: ZIP family metal transporter [Planctomycetes bacterium]|nr:ZIP family metal transporter [Planctomycetota bacterium]